MGPYPLLPLPPPKSLHVIVIPALDRAKLAAGVGVIIHFSARLAYFERDCGKRIAKLQHRQQVYRLPYKLGRRAEGQAIVHAAALWR